MHTALVAAAYTLTPPPSRVVRDPVTVDIFSRPAPKPETPPKKVELPKPEPPRPEAPKVASLQRPSSMTAPAPVQPPAQPEPLAQPEPPPPGEKKKVDLTLHALPGAGGDNSVILPSGVGSLGGTMGPQSGVPGGKKPWHVDAGNPLFGKLDEEKEDRYPLRPTGDGGYQYKGKAFTANIARDGRVSFDNKSIRDFKGLSGGFDITDMMMRGKGNDPYRVEKDKFLATTDAMRDKMRKTTQKERMEASLLTLPRTLDETWHTPGLSAERRRSLLHSHWLDAASSVSEMGEEAKHACEIIEAYVRRWLPEGTPDAYSEEELDTLNRGKKFKFQPYR